MTNRYHGNLTGNGKHTGGQGGSNAAQGKKAAIVMPEKTVNWPGLPGKSGPSRTGGAPGKGPLGDFYVHRKG